MGADANETALNQTLNFKQLLTRLKSYFWEKTYNRNVYSNNTTEVKKLFTLNLNFFWLSALPDNGDARTFSTIFANSKPNSKPNSKIT